MLCAGAVLARVNDAAMPVVNGSRHLFNSAIVAPRAVQPQFASICPTARFARVQIRDRADPSSRASRSLLGFVSALRPVEVPRRSSSHMTVAAAASGGRNVFSTPEAHPDILSVIYTADDVSRAVQLLGRRGYVRPPTAPPSQKGCIQHEQHSSVALHLL